MLLPRIIKKSQNIITIVMPFPSSIAKNIYCIDQWKSIYETDKTIADLFAKLSLYNLKILDVYINFINAESYFIMRFDSKEELNCFLIEMKQYVLQ